MVPKISIITIVYNDRLGIEKTIQSVINQSCSDSEYIIIDANSTDGTVDIIKKYQNNIEYWISEKDEGISDAFNKGIKNAKGEWLIFLNSGDIFATTKILEEIESSNILDKTKSLIFYGLVYIINKKGRTVFFGKEFEKGKFEKGMTICHQGSFINKDYFINYGLYNVNFKIAMDYELLLRSRDYNYVFFNKIISRIEAGGISQQNIKNVYKEFLSAKLLHVKKNGMLIYFEYLYYYFIYKISVILKFWKL